MPTVALTKRALLAAASAAALSVVLQGYESAHALVSSRPAALLTETNATDAYPFSIAGDADDNWVAVWRVVSPTLEMRSAHYQNGVLSTPSFVTAGGGIAPVIATDRNGTWIVVWDNDVVIEVLRSTNYGGAWTPVLSIPEVDLPWLTGVATDGAGDWMVVFTAEQSANPTGPDQDIYFSRSTDNGVNWSVAAPVNSDAAVDTLSDINPVIATDGAGRWVVSWTRDDEQAGATTSDLGDTWTAPNVVADQYPSGGVDLQYGNGLWMLVWENEGVSSVRSTDGGATWTMPAILADEANTEELFPRLATDGGDTWYALWSAVPQLGTFFDVRIIRSVDGGLSWSTPAFLNTDATRYPDTNLWPVLDTGGAGNWLGAWSYSHEGDQIGFATYHDDCPVLPRNDCIAVDSKVRLENRSGDGDALKWNARIGAGPIDFGDPTVSTDYTFCLYDSVIAGSRSVLELDARGARFAPLGSRTMTAGA